MEHVGDGGECLHRDAAGVQGVAHLFQRDPGLARRDRPQRIGMRLQDRPAMAADLGWGRAACPANPLHELDCRRRAHLKALGRSPRRTARFNETRDPLAQILR
jgi:hypothetical protein